MATVCVPVDVYNPGQVFACVGLMEAALTLVGDATASFAWHGPGSEQFWLATPGPEDPVAEVLDFLRHCDVTAVAPTDSQLRCEKWKIATDVVADWRYPFAEPTSPATLVAALTRGTQRLTIEHWGDSTDRDNVKFWAGSGGYPGAALLRDAVELIPKDADLDALVADPFAVSAVQSSSFRFDWRKDYIPLDTGFSLNVHTAIQTRGYPLVEVLAALGLQHARPVRINKLRYRYGIVGGPYRHREVAPDLLPPLFIRAGLGASPLPFPRRTFDMRLSWPGKENQARSITQATEELAP